MLVRKNLTITLHPSEEQEHELTECAEEYQRVCNIVSKWFFYEHQLRANRKQFNCELYNKLRKNAPRLNSAMIQLTYLTVTKRYHRLLSLLKNVGENIDRVSLIKQPLNFAKMGACYAYKMNYSFPKKGKFISLSVLSKRIRLPYTVKPDHPLMAATNHFGVAQLMRLFGHWYLIVPVSYEENLLSPDGKI